ncbi:MAG: hypothetical protein FWE33_02330 [Defluviitaleaceae bacterium]|nr:hypothetical protein [Defluviitaleaceae bacterium]
MQCENAFCVYNTHYQCCFSTIEINSLGMCENCIIISLDDIFLEAEKEKQRANLASRLL